MPTKAQQHPDPDAVAEVVIYAYVYGLLPSEQHQLIRGAREYAAERGWKVLDQVTDDCPPSTARRLRPGWRRVANCIAERDRQVEGIVCPREECLTDDPRDRSVIGCVWRTSRGSRSGPRRPAPGPAAATRRR
ncbi:hypothetical protein AB0I84_32015 [Streptomyces spectabilis]|uniref:hypothetical protein n=1 Tax=Streptomyces spectabilis TaxID=68270 RepID=UPI0033C7CDC8